MAIKKIGLIPKLIIGILLGIFLGYVTMTLSNKGFKDFEIIMKIIVTLANFFSLFLKFVIPLMILAFITKGISDLTQGAGKLLGFTTLVSYISTLIAGTIAYIVAINLFPHFISNNAFTNLNDNSNFIQPLFYIDLKPIFDVTSAVVLAFLLGLSISTMRGKEIGNTTYDFFTEFSIIITKVLNKVIIPLLPFYILSTFANLTYSGEAFSILSVLWKVFLTVIILHILYLIAIFIFAGITSNKNPITLLKNQIPGYLTAIGTQSSAATIPVNLTCAEKNNTSKEIREFVIPLCANIHLAGSMITITSCVTSVLLMNNMDINIGMIVSFILTLAVVMIASPGAPGGAIMSAVPFLSMVGIDPDGAIAGLLITLYITQDSFGTACNVSGDNAIAIIVDNFYKKYINKN
ncbi:dicarboxylate/amino acid:cation symporter [uncultured Tyzzerella sp.]|uniref:dicarboxylate/amino acid:cation symporter n=1 Tax=uncultured Tyzzerella sp. TaxID=2321398 RepID=UPI002943B5D3|nr:dicarboxylate/amino acid:cation symporter [uncultured Tyzzerella sp.]